MRGAKHPMPGMRILALCDLHDNRPWYDWVLGEAKGQAWDLIVIAGDFLDQFSLKRSRADQIAFHLEWFEAMEATGQPWVFCSGNHDENDEPLVIVTNDPLPRSLHRAFRESRWMDCARGPGVVVDGKNGLLQTRKGAVVVTAVPWRFGVESLSLRRPHPDDVQLIRAGRESAAKESCPWVLLIHDPPSPSRISTSRAENATRILVQAFQPDLCVSGHLHEAPLVEDGNIAVRIGRTLCINPGRAEGSVPRAVAIEIIDGEWRARLIADE